MALDTPHALVEFADQQPVSKNGRVVICDCFAQSTYIRRHLPELTVYRFETAINLIKSPIV